MPESMKVVAGTGNPEVADYLAGLSASDPVPVFRSSRQAAAITRGMKRIGDQNIPDAELDRLIEEIRRNGDPEPGSYKADLSAAYQNLLAERH